MAEIIVFRSGETPELNYPEIEKLLDAMGMEQGLQVFERVMFEISDILCQLELAIHEGDLETAQRRARTLRTLSPQVGLECLAHVACDIIDVIRCNDLTILPAVGHRIICLGEACLFQMAELPRVLSDR